LRGRRFSSVFDTITMIVGFVLPCRLPVWTIVAFAVVIEVALACLIHDNFTLNILMIIHPIEAIKAWQAAAPLQ
jgi:Protein of unknown function (DUF2585)